MIDYFFFGKAKEERAQLRAISHFLAKRVRYGRDILPTALLSRLQEARSLCATALEDAIRTKTRDSDSIR